MTNTKTYDARNALLDYSVYAPLGATQVAFDKGKEFTGKVFEMAKARREAMMKGYRDLAVRGEKLAKSVRNSAYTKRAVSQTRTARTQVKSAATSVRKAAESTAEATRAAARKAG
jgi:heparin binding hemagglutinin HbhA